VAGVSSIFWIPKTAWIGKINVIIVQLKEHHANVPDFQTSVRAGLQGAFNLKGRQEFLQRYMNKLVEQELLTVLLHDVAFLDFFGLSSKFCPLIL
jgi:hypothetical protein